MITKPQESNILIFINKEKMATTLSSMSNQEEIIKEIIELKLKHPLSEKDKLKLQRLQQKLNT